MSATQPLDRLTASDLFLLWDDYGWTSDIGGLAIMDGANLVDGDGEVRIDSIRKHLDPKLQAVRRFRQLLYRPRFGLGWRLWVDAPSFDIADHVKVRRVAAPGDEAALLEACEELARRPMDHSRPLWELWLLPGLGGGRVGAYLKLHHAIADGTAAIAAFGALLDFTPETSEAVATEWTPDPLPSTSDLLRDNLRRRTHELGRGLSGLVHPARTWKRTRRVLPAWREVLADKPAPGTSLNRPVGHGRRLALVRSRLEPLKDSAHAHHGKVGDVVLAAVAGGLRELLLGRGELANGLTQRAMVTLSEHQEGAIQASGNKPGWMMVQLPLDEPDPVRRLEVIAGETAAAKQQARPEAGTGPFRFVLGQRIWYWMFPRQKAVNIVVTNVPGPPVPLYFAGAKLLEVFPMMPTMGNLTVVVAALSYAGQLNVTVVGDRDACPDIDHFARGVRQTLEDLAALPLEAAS